MQWIDTSNYSPSTEWKKKAERLTRSLHEADTAEERKEIIKRNANMWRDLKDELLMLSNNKCWYSEAKKTVSFFDVDHFRPKGIVKHLDMDSSINIEEGYWWLAFDWKNYRPCGEICNRKISDREGVCRGKQDFFPLKEGCTCAGSPDYDISKEIPYILDPTVETDITLLDFDLTGHPVEAAPMGTFEYMRAHVTIKLLYLDNPLLVDERLKIWNRCQRLINEIANMWIERDCSSSAYEKIVKSKIKELKTLSNKDEEFSSCAKACLVNSEYSWARRLATSN